jgi:hypothetical protein
MLLDSMKYDNLFYGDGVDVVTEEITISASQTIKRGDVLVKSAGNYAKATAAIKDVTFSVDHIVAADIVCLASEDITTGVGETAKSIGYLTGEFNEFAMGFGGASTADDNRDALAARSIYIKKANKQ